jgi:hypothetical protein
MKIGWEGREKGMRMRMRMEWGFGRRDIGVMRGV